MHAILFAIFLFLVPLRANTAYLDQITPENVQWMQTRICSYVLITIPGSGTHLVEKAIFLLNQTIPRWHFNQKSMLVFGFSLDPDYPSYLCTHFWMAPRTVEIHDALQLKKIICIRDLRDVMVTVAHKMRAGSWPGYNWHFSEALRAFRELSFDEQLLFVINMKYEPVPIREIRQFSFPLVFDQALEYMQDPDVLVIRYEDLVGEKGNGTKEAQMRELRRLAKILDVALSDEKLEEISDHLYGDRPDEEQRLKVTDPQITFRKGKIGSWKEAFKDEHKQAFKEKYGEALILMGYEQSNDW